MITKLSRRRKEKSRDPEWLTKAMWNQPHSGFSFILLVHSLLCALMWLCVGVVFDSVLGIPSGQDLSNIPTDLPDLKSGFNILYAARHSLDIQPHQRTALQDWLLKLGIIKLDSFLPQLCSPVRRFGQDCLPDVTTNLSRNQLRPWVMAFSHSLSNLHRVLSA